MIVRQRGWGVGGETPDRRSNYIRIDFQTQFILDEVYRVLLGLINNLIDGGQQRDKPHLRKAKPDHVLKTVFSPRLVTVNQVVG